MKRLLLFSVFVSAAMACSRSGKPLVVESAAGVGKEYIDPHYFREAPLAWKVLWFIGPGH
jgi:hypothetical protein